jgi:hypothetical protein
MIERLPAQMPRPTSHCTQKMVIAHRNQLLLQLQAAPISRVVAESTVTLAPVLLWFPPHAKPLS